MEVVLQNEKMTTNKNKTHKKLNGTFIQYQLYTETYGM